MRILGGLVVLVACGGGGGHVPIDAPDFGARCTPGGTFALGGRAAVQGVLNVHVNASGLVEVDTTAELLLAMDLTQQGTTVTVHAEPCAIKIPDIPLAGQDQPIQFEVPAATLASVGIVAGTATLSSPDQACADFTSAPITLVLGARLDPQALATATLPAADASGVFRACPPSADTGCALAIGTGCACDQEADRKPGATLFAHNVPAVDLHEVYVALRARFSLAGQVWSDSLIRGTIDAQLDQGILACALTSGAACTSGQVRAVAQLNPAITPQPGNPSTFRAVTVPATTTCAEIVSQRDTLFPR
jgi:hypothetical protein